VSDSQAKKNLLQSLLLLTGLFIFSQICLLIVTSSGYLSLIVQKRGHESLYIYYLLSSLGSYFTAQLIINSIFFMSIWYQTISIAQLLQWRGAKLPMLGRFIWVLNTVVLIVANAYYFPNSVFAKLLLEKWLSGAALTYTLIIGGCLLAVSISLTLLTLFTSLYRKKELILHSSVLAFLVWIACVFTVYSYEAAPVSMAYATSTKPNVILIGLDALRPDFIANNALHSIHTPTINNFLQTAVVLADARTPLARTFPAWVSILTGKYPKHTNARANLVNLKYIKLDETLAKKFAANGYQTIYASDDTMFSKIDKNYGFDVTTGPSPGIGTYMGLMNDFPLSNFVSISPFGHYLFPYNYACHTNAHTYVPENFLHLINTALHNRAERPVFLSVHFTLTGWPYFWARQIITTNTTLPDMYADGASALDSQLNSFLLSLKANHLLDHAVVVLLSDHGTGLGLPGDRVTDTNLFQGDKNAIKLSSELYSVPPRDTQGRFIKRGVNTTYGYGNDVLSLAYDALLVFKTYGTHPLPPHAVHGLASLIDIAPSILDLLDMPPFAAQDGMSLKPYLIATQKDISPEREVYLETSDSMAEIEGQHISSLKVIKKASENYYIDKFGAVIMKDKKIREIANSTEKAIVQGDWLLADLPVTTRYHLDFQKKIFAPYLAAPQVILVNLKTGLWTTDLHSTFAQTAPVDQLSKKLISFYGDELSAL
jgi:arylsulfatase A-like enzyme